MIYIVIGSYIILLVILGLTLRSDGEIVIEEDHIDGREKWTLVYTGNPYYISKKKYVKFKVRNLKNLK